MATLRSGLSLLRNCPGVTSRLNISTSCTSNNVWRIQQGLEPNPLTYGSLTLLPDYSFVDGRPIILSDRKMKNLDRQRKLCEKIARYSNELDVSLEQYNQMLKEVAAERQAILDSKLKPKGVNLLKKKEKRK